MRFKTNIVHRIQLIWKRGYFYRCNHAVGKLKMEQRRKKTNEYGRKITCKNCKRWKK